MTWKQICRKAYRDQPSFAASSMFKVVPFRHAPGSLFVAASKGILLSQGL
jgi:hypothetical protein